MKKFFAILLAAIMCVALAGCGQSAVAPSPTPDEKVDLSTLNVAFLKGPTAIGAVQILENKDGYKSVTVISDTNDMATKFISKEVDIAAVPTNLASVLYNRTNGDVRVLAVNTLGVLYILSSDENIKSMSDLSGKTIWTSGKGGVPEYVINDLIEQYKLSDVTVEYASEHSEVAAKAVSGSADVVLVPEPFVTAILGKTDMKVAVDITDAWSKVHADTPLVMGCIIAHKDTDDAMINEFLVRYNASAEYAVANVDATAKTIGDLGILDEAVVKSAIPRCNIVCIRGSEMKTAMSTFLTTLFNAEPKSVGGSLPGDDFYYGN